MHASSACGRSNILYFDLCGHFECLWGVKGGMDYPSVLFQLYSQQVRVIDLHMLRVT